MGVRSEAAMEMARGGCTRRRFLQRDAGVSWRQYYSLLKSSPSVRSRRSSRNDVRFQCLDAVAVLAVSTSDNFVVAPDMKRVRIAIIGETTIGLDGKLTRSGAIASAISGLRDTEVTLRAVAPDEASALSLDNALSAVGVKGIITHRDGAGDTPSIRNGDTLDIWGLFDHDVVVMDFDDPALRFFLTDLPAHTKPDVRLAGTLNYVLNPLSQFEREVAMRFDTLIGTADQFRRMSDTDDALSALMEIHDRMRGVNLRAAVLVDEDRSLKIAAIGDHIHTIPLTTGSGPLEVSRIIAHTAVCVARRAEWSTIADTLTTDEHAMRPILAK